MSGLYNVLAATMQQISDMYGVPDFAIVHPSDFRRIRQQLKNKNLINRLKR